jgi:hypothetical protein
MAHPPWMYVNYLTDDHNVKAPAYRFALESNEDLQTAVEEAVVKIKGNTAKPVPGSPCNIEWHYPSYMVFVLDSIDQQLNSVSFWLNEDASINNAFGKGKTLKNFDNCTAMYYVNLRRNKKDELLGAEAELYSWKTSHSLRSAKKDHDRRGHENSGQNVGP